MHFVKKKAVRSQFLDRLFNDFIRRQTRQTDCVTVKETRRFLAEKLDVIALRHYLNDVVFVPWNYLTFDDHKSAKAVVNAKMRNITKIESGASGTTVYNR